MPESPKWLAARGKAKQASKNLSLINEEKVKVAKKTVADTKFTDIFKPKYLKLTILSAVPWFLMDIAFYGVGIFTPIILTKVFKYKAHNFIEEDLYSIKGALFVACFLIVGIVIAIILIKKKGMIKLSALGFYGMALGMIILMSSMYALNTVMYTPLVITGFVLFYLCVNAGPNPMTFMIPARVYPTELRATGHGFSAAFAKARATLGIVIFPWLELEMGIGGISLVMAGVCIAGGIVTQMFAAMIIRDKELYKYKKIIADLKGIKNIKADNNAPPTQPQV